MMLEIMVAAIMFAVYVLVVRTYGLRRLREKEARESVSWPDGFLD